MGRFLLESSTRTLQTPVAGGRKEGDDDEEEEGQDSDLYVVVRRAVREMRWTW